MTKHVTLQPSGEKFPLLTEQSILEAALTANINLEYSCTNGQCGQCIAKLIKGDIHHKDYDPSITLQEAELLTCCSYPQTDVTLEADFYPELSHIERKTVPAKLDQLEKINDDTAILTLRLPPTAQFIFLPGQFVDLMWNDSKRSYSIASNQVINNKLELHIKKVENGLFSDFIFNEAANNQLFRFHGPLGTFFVRNNNAPLIFLCTGTGFAPVKAMVENLIDNNDERPIYIFWGAQYRDNLYSKLPQQWAENYSHIHFTPVLSRESKLLDNEVKGYCQDAVTKRINNLTPFTVYACGSDDMIHSAKKQLSTHGLNPNNFHSDAFLSSK